MLELEPGQRVRWLSANGRFYLRARVVDPAEIGKVATVGHTWVVRQQNVPYLIPTHKLKHDVEE